MQSSYTGLTGLNAALGWLNQVSDNMANMQTVGFAQDRGTFADTLTMQLGASATDPANAQRYTPPGWRGGTGVAYAGEGHMFSGMTMQQTGGNTDFAIHGPGFFVVKGPNGPLYTKAGNFTWSRNASGRFELATPNGLPVLSAAGQPIIKPINPTSFTVGANGQITFGNTPGPTLGMVEINQPSEHLIAQNHTLYALGPGGKANPAKSSQVIQGALDYSNVNIAKQMADMIDAQNLYDLNSESVQLTSRMNSAVASIQP